jgi:hypothetical protein
MRPKNQVNIASGSQVNQAKEISPKIFVYESLPVKPKLNGSN